MTTRVQDGELENLLARLEGTQRFLQKVGVREEFQADLDRAGEVIAATRSWLERVKQEAQS